VTFSWLVRPSEAFPPLAEAQARAMHRGVRALADAYAPQIEVWMKQEAPWTDRTGNARQTLFGEVQEVVNQMVAVVIGHGVDYGIYLELKNAGRYAIVNPALDFWAPRLWADVVAMLS
jgi:hypothetical protein